jgi:high-affinity nickel permease
VIGRASSGGFLFLIGVLNLLILVNIVKVFRRMRVEPVRRAGAGARARGARRDDAPVRTGDQTR